MDDDVDRAFIGDRVGIALRGMGDDALEKGSQVVKDGSDILSRAKRSRLQLEISIFQKKQPNRRCSTHVL